jgi:pyridoxamine 5'-phosphate oxidase
LKSAHDNSVIVEANAMVLSTIASDGQVNTRTVLLKDISGGGFTFFTNYQSRKAHAIDVNPHVSRLFPWYAMERQISISGIAEKFQLKNLMNTLQLVPGVPKLVHGQVTNHLHCHLAKS